MDILSTAGKPITTRTGAHFTVRPASSLSYSEAWRPLRTPRHQRDEAEESRSGAKTEPRLHYPSRTCGVVRGQSLEMEKSPIKLNQNGVQDKSSEFERGRQGRTEWRRNNLLNRSKSLDWRAGGKSPERPQSFRGDFLSRTRDKSAEGSRVLSTIHAYNTVNKPPNNPDTSLSKARGQSLPNRYVSASLGPKGGQSILERIEKLYGSVAFGNAEDCKTTEHYKSSFSGTFPRRFSSSGEHRLSAGLSGDSFSSKDPSASSSLGLNKTRTAGWWQNQENSSYVEGGTFQSRGFPDIGTRSLDRARSRSTLAAKIRAAEEMDKPAQFNTFLTGISEVSSIEGRGEKMEDIERKNWSRTTIKERKPVKTEVRADDKLQLQKETPSDDVFESQKSQLKKTNDKPIARTAASVRNKINQFEALTQRAQTSLPRRAFSVPEHLSKSCSGVQRSSSAKAFGTFKWAGLKEEQTEWRGTTDIETFVLKGEKKQDQERRQDQDKTTKREIYVKSFYEDESKLKRVTDKEFQNTKDSKDFNECFKTKLDLPISKVSSPITNVIHFDETDFSKGPMKLRDDSASSSSGISTPIGSDNEETPTNTPGTSPLVSPTAPPQKTPPFAVKSLDISPPLTSNLPDLVSKDNLNGKKRILDLNAWLDGLNPQVKVWKDDGDEDDDSTQKDDDSNYDSDSGESSVTVTSAMSNKSFSVSLADLCNFAGVDSDSENDSDEWQSSGRRSVSLSSDVSGFSCVSVLPTEELDKLIQDVKSIGDDNLQDYEDVHVVVLHKEIGVGLGFSLAGGVDQNKPVTIHKVFHSGAAAQEGSIKEGDQVLSINGSALSGCAHWEALRVLRRAKGREMGVVVLKKPDVRALSNQRALAVTHNPTPTQINETESTHIDCCHVSGRPQKGQRITVKLEKSDRDLGFSLEGGVDSSLGNKPLTVQKIFQGGPVQKVLPGDEVLEVNGVSVVGLRRLEAWTLIRKLPPGPVNVVLLRNPQPHKT